MNPTPNKDETAWEYLHRVVAQNDNDDCWIWPFYLTPGKWRYGGVYAPRAEDPLHRSLRVHKVAFKLRFGQWPEPCGLHRCDNPSCFNPNHVFAGSLKDNTQDMLKKGRNRYVLPFGGKGRPGELHPFAKLTDEDVREILRTYVPRKNSQYKLAKKFGVQQTNISAIVSRKAWKHVSV
jgi:hypothetical protein